VNSSPDLGQGYVAISANDVGYFIVTWSADGATDSGGIFARSFGPDGSALEDEHQVDSETSEMLWYPSVDINDVGESLIAWQSWEQNIAWDIYARRYDSTGSPIGNEFQVNGYAANWQTDSSVVVDEFGDIVIAYRSGLQDGNSNGIFAKRFGTDSDRDGVLDADELSDCYPGRSSNRDIEDRGYTNGLNQVHGRGLGLYMIDPCRETPGTEDGPESRESLLD
jgi:hypothetical protein